MSSTTTEENIERLKIRERLLMIIFCCENTLFPYAPDMYWEYKEDVLNIIRRTKSLLERVENDIDNEKG